MTLSIRPVRPGEAGLVLGFIKELAELTGGTEAMASDMAAAKAEAEAIPDIRSGRDPLSFVPGNGTIN